MNIQNRQKVKIKDILSDVIDNRGKTPPLSNTGYPMIEVNQLSRDTRYPKLSKKGKQKYVSNNIYNSWFRDGHPQQDDILISTVGTIALWNLVPMDSQFCIAQNLVALRPDKSKVDPEFLRYYFNQRKFIRQVEGIVIGATQPSIKLPHFLNLNIEIPSLNEQKIISSVLTSLEKKIELNNEIAKTLEEMAHVVFKELFIKFQFLGYDKAELVESKTEYGLIPKGWEVKPMEYVCAKITDGSHFSPKTVSHGKPMASVKDMTTWGFNVDTCRKITEEDYNSLVKNDCKPLINDILIAKDGSYLKHIFMLDKEQDIVILSSIAILRPNGKVLPNLLMLFLKQPQVLAQMKAYVSGVAIPRIVLRDFRKFPTLVPPLTIQKQCANIIDPMLDKCRALMRENENLNAMRNLLLPMLMKGDLNL